MKSLDFERPLDDLYEKIDELRQLSQEGNVDLSEEIIRLENRANNMRKDIFSNLSPAQVLQVARHPNRPDTMGLSGLIFDDFVELHGDRLYRDDPSIVAGLARLGEHRLVVIGHQKGHDTKEKIYRNFGMPHPEGYRKALRIMKMGERFSMPIVTFIDTPGAYPGKEAEERGQAEAIARNLQEMSGLTVPVLTFVIGEGGSGGALGIAVSNKIFMMEYAVYSVISPEGCASILFRDANQACYAAEKLKITAKDIVELGIADTILSEPLGGGHNDWQAVAVTIQSTLKRELSAYAARSVSDIVNERYNKFRSFGKFQDMMAS